MKKTMKVLAIVPSLLQTSGAGRFCAQTVGRLATQNDVKILSEVYSEGVLPTQLGTRSKPALFIKNCLLARSAAKDSDIVHAFDAWPYGVYGLCAVIGTKRKLVISGIGTYSVAPLHRTSTRALVTWAYKRAAAIPCISHYTELKIKEVIPEAKTSVVFMGTTALPIAGTVLQEKMRARFGITDKTYPVLITVGEIKERKGQLDTLQALVHIRELFPEFKYVVVGKSNPSYVADMETFAAAHGMSDHLSIVSDIRSDEDLSALYQIAHVQSLMSNNDELHFEGFGLVLLEGAQFGIPALGSIGCGIEDAINDGISGLLIPQKDTLGIAQGIKDIMARYDEFKRGAQEWYTHFSWDDSVTQLQKIYESI